MGKVLNKYFNKRVGYHHDQSFSRTNYNANKKRIIKNFILFFLTFSSICLVFTVTALLIVNSKIKPDKFINLVDVSTKKDISFKTTSFSKQTFSNEVNAIINNNTGFNFEVSVENLNNQRIINFGPTTPMISASVSKILTAADFLKQVELGKQNSDEILDDGNNASYDLQQMITISSDTAWEALNEQVGYLQLQDYADLLGLDSYNYIHNTLSASNTVKLYGDLYNGELLNKTDTNLILTYMKIANYRTYIVQAVPSSDTVYHKIGLLGDEINDAAIITNGKHSIALAIYSENKDTTEDASALHAIFQQITKVVLQNYDLD